MKKKYFGSMAAFLTLAAMTMNAVSAPVTADAASGEVMVALGDSITTGYSKDGTLIASYAELVSSYYNAELVNLAEDGATTANLLTKLSDASVQQTVAGADVILVTIGGNDIMQPVLNNDYINTSQYDTMIELINGMSDQGLMLQTALNVYLSRTMPDVIAECNSNIEQIAAQLRSLNGNAEIVFQTVYNPMDLDADNTALATSGSMELLSTYVTNYLEGMENNILYETGINETIRGLQGVTVVDSYQALFDHAYYYTGISAVDVHPNSIGHLVIAESMIAAMQRAEDGKENGTLMRAAYTGSGAEQTLSGVNAALNESILGSVLKNSYGDVDANGTVDLADASAALGLYASEAAGSEPSVTGVNAQAADGNQDGKIDLADASDMLGYYAANAAGAFSGSFGDYIAQK